MGIMRAKMRVTEVRQHRLANGDLCGETLHFSAVSRDDGYPDDGSDEDNTYARFSPMADLKIEVHNPNLYERFSVGQKFYVDFTEAPA